jgi:hypothetical protein
VFSEQMFAVSCEYSLIVVAVERIHPATPGSEFLGLDTLLATPDTAKALFQCSAHALSSGVAAFKSRGIAIQSLRRDNTRCLVVTEALGMTMARSHFDAAVANVLMVL